MKKILLIGGEGYIGKIVSNYLLKNNYFVISYDNLIYIKDKKNYKYNLQNNFKFEYGDISNLKKLNELTDNIDSVVILAGLVGDPITKKYPDISKKINLIYLKNIIDLIKKKKICKTIFISTCSNYGLIPDNMYADEGFKLNPLSLYAKAKVSIERYIISQIKYENFNPTILRFATAFGLSQRMRFDLTVNEFTRDILLGKSLEIYDKNTWRPYCHVKDFARLIKIVIESKQDLVKFETFNAGGDKNNATKKNIIDKIADHIEVNKIKYLENGFDTRNYKVDFTKVKRVLNFIPKYDISDGIKEIINELSINDDKYANKLDFGNYKIEE